MHMTDYALLFLKWPTPVRSMMWRSTVVWLQLLAVPQGLLSGLRPMLQLIYLFIVAISTAQLVVARAAFLVWDQGLVSSPLLGLAPLPQLRLDLRPRPPGVLEGLAKWRRCSLCCIMAFRVWGLSSWEPWWIFKWSSLVGTNVGIAYSNRVNKSAEL
jgi:hypothetical protein